MATILQSIKHIKRNSNWALNQRLESNLHNNNLSKLDLNRSSAKILRFTEDINGNLFPGDTLTQRTRYNSPIHEGRPHSKSGSFSCFKCKSVWRCAMGEHKESNLETIKICSNLTISELECFHVLLVGLLALSYKSYKSLIHSLQFESHNCWKPCVVIVNKESQAPRGSANENHRNQVSNTWNFENFRFILRISSAFGKLKTKCDRMRKMNKTRNSVVYTSTGGDKHLPPLKLSVFSNNKRSSHLKLLKNPSVDQSPVNQCVKQGEDLLSIHLQNELHNLPNSEILSISEDDSDNSCKHNHQSVCKRFSKFKVMSKQKINNPESDEKLNRLAFVKHESDSKQITKQKRMRIIKLRKDKEWGEKKGANSKSPSLCLPIIINSRRNCSTPVSVIRNSHNSSVHSLISESWQQKVNVPRLRRSVGKLIPIRKPGRVNLNIY